MWFQIWPAAGQTDHMQGLDCLMMTGCSVQTIFSRQQNSFQHRALKARQFISRVLNSNVYGNNYHNGSYFKPIKKDEKTTGCV